MVGKTMTNSLELIGLSFKGKVEGLLTLIQKDRKINLDNIILFMLIS